jgi:hypothetical protein
VAAIALAGAIGAAQENRPAAKDPRVGLKPGLKNAGEAMLNLEHVASLAKPEGFFDPKHPAGEPMEPPPADGAKPGDAAAKPAAPDAKPDAAAKPVPKTQKPGGAAGALNFANSDLAFSGKHLFIGNFNGYNIYDLSDPKKLKLIASVICPGGQGDVSVHGNLLIMSVEQTRGRLDCGASGVQEVSSPERFRGVRIFDISDVRKPKQIAAVQTCRGSHTHTLVTDPKDKENIYIYGSGTGGVRAGEELAGCSGLDPKEDPNTALYSIDVIQVPLAAPQTAKVVNRPRIFADASTGAIAGLWAGGAHGPGTQTTALTNHCHDITVFPEIGLAAGACSGNGILLDISNPAKPERIDQVTDKSFAYWHSATFNNDGSKVIFTDEWGGGTRPRCLATDSPSWGANAIFNIVDRKMQFAGYYKLPAPQSEVENCVAHNGSIIPVPGRDIMAQAWYQGGISIFDFTDPAKPVEIAYFDRGPIDPARLIVGGFWSAYWYNGYIYGAEMARGIDVFRLKPSQFLSQNEIDAAALAKADEFNAQEQPKVSWPASPVVARAYVDQLARTNAIDAARASALRTAIDRGASAKAQLATLAGELSTAAASAGKIDAARMKSLAATLTGIAGQ